MPPRLPFPAGRIINLTRFAICFLSIASATRGTATPLSTDWHPVDVPTTWERKDAHALPPNREFAWFQCLIQLPADWTTQAIELFLEPADDAREIYWNGQRIGAQGNLPPNYRSGLGANHRLEIPQEHIRQNKPNQIAIRVFANDSRSGFNLAPPVLFAASQAIVLRGSWLARAGDLAPWAGNETSKTPPVPLYSKVENAAQVRINLTRLENDNGPLPPLQALAKLRHPEDLELDLVLSEPDIHQPLSLKFDDRGRLWVVEYLQYPNPAGLNRLSHDMHLRSVYDRVPPPPPGHIPGKDRITIHEDLNGDGTFDRHTTFLEGLSLVSSIAIGRGGVWALNPPYLLFYPDRDADDRPDGDPEVRLEGFGIEDSHSVANSLRWGPDGWLYGAQGSTVTGDIRTPGNGKPGVRTMGQLIWRYHPEARQFEVFAEGGGNTFGIEIDSKGRIYSGHNGGNTRGFHYVQGGYYLKGFQKHGSLSNPHAFGYFNAMRHPQAPRFTHTFLIYEGANLPEHYAGRLFGIEPLQGRVVCSDVQVDGSSFRTVDLSHPVESDDSWFRPVDIQAGPDGSIYIADFYEQRIDHASHYQGRIHRNSGRVYRLRAAGKLPSPRIHLSSLSTDQLISLLSDRNKWTRQTAQRILGDRNDPGSIPNLHKLLMEQTGQPALESLWALNLAGGLTDAVVLEALAHKDPNVRAWAIRIACDNGQVNEPIASQLGLLARVEPDVRVRSQLASSARRISSAGALPILQNLLQHSEDLHDVHLPLLLWWAIESKLDTDRTAVLRMISRDDIWDSPLFRDPIAERLMRRFASGGTRNDFSDCVQLLRRAGGAQPAGQLLAGLESAFVGRAMTGLPEELLEEIARVEDTSLIHRLRRSNPDAIREALELVALGRSEGLQLVQIFESLARIRVPEAVPALLQFVRTSSDDIARRSALATLSLYNRAEIGVEVIGLHGTLPPPVRETAELLLASRSGWTLTFLDNLEAGTIPRITVSDSVKRTLLLFDDPGIRTRVLTLWPDLHEVSGDLALREIGRMARTLEAGLGNPYEGKVIYQTRCGVCHTMFAEGGNVGPDLTPYQRNDLQGLLMNIVMPNAEIREGYEQVRITTTDQRTVNGFLADQNNRVIVVRTPDSQTSTVVRNEIESLESIPSSLMPEGLLSDLTDVELRDLFAYLRIGQPLPR